MVKKDLSQRVNLLIYQLIVPPLASWPKEQDCGYKWLKWASSMWWLNAPAAGWGAQSPWRSLESSCRSTAWTKASQSGSSICYGRLPREVFLVCLTGHQERPRTRWRDYLFQLAWERFGVLRDELEKLTRAGEVRVFLLRLLRPRTILDNAAEKVEAEEGEYTMNTVLNVCLVNESGD